MLLFQRQEGRIPVHCTDWLTCFSIKTFFVNSQGKFYIYLRSNSYPDEKIIVHTVVSF